MCLPWVMAAILTGVCSWVFDSWWIKILAPIVISLLATVWMCEANERLQNRLRANPQLRWAVGAPLSEFFWGLWVGGVHLRWPSPPPAPCA